MHPRGNQENRVMLLAYGCKCACNLHLGNRSRSVGGLRRNSSPSHKWSTEFTIMQLVSGSENCRCRILAVIVDYRLRISYYHTSRVVLNETNPFL